jgi:hypothetical protein
MLSFTVSVLHAAVLAVGALAASEEGSAPKAPLTLGEARALPKDAVLVKNAAGDAVTVPMDERSRRVPGKLRGRAILDHEWKDGKVSFGSHMRLKDVHGSLKRNGDKTTLVVTALQSKGPDTNKRKTAFEKAFGITLGEGTGGGSGSGSGPTPTSAPTRAPTEFFETNCATNVETGDGDLDTWYPMDMSPSVELKCYNCPHGCLMPNYMPGYTLAHNEEIKLEFKVSVSGSNMQVRIRANTVGASSSCRSSNCYLSQFNPKTVSQSTCYNYESALNTVFSDVKDEIMAGDTTTCTAAS